MLSAATSPDVGQDHGKIKKRELRKGTHSCWECKRRKMKCVFASRDDSTICEACRRRGSTCLTQEVPEELARHFAKSRHAVGGAAVRSISSIVTSSPEVIEQLPSTPKSRHEHELETSDATLSAPTHNDNSTVSWNSASQGQDAEISRILYAALPTLEDTKRIYRAKPPLAVPAHELMTMPYTALFQGDLENQSSLLEAANPQWHPVLLAKHMLMLASSLIHLHPSVHPEIRHLSETPRAMSERLAGLASRHVVSKDEMLGSIEMLECILIESMYHANLGNLRRSWMTVRRALTVAQLMGLHRANGHAQYEVLNPDRTHDLPLMWSRILFVDRLLCILLGLPAGWIDTSVPDTASIDEDLPTGRRFERIHSIVAGHIIARAGPELSSQDLYITQQLDLELQSAARSLPAKWWLAPNFHVDRSDPQALFWNTGRMWAQVVHYNLVNQLHLPYMLRSSSTDHTFEYSRITCINASREILTRFITLRNFNDIASSCRLIDVIALMAALTLLFAHMDSASAGPVNLLAHQYHSDRAMIEQVQGSMEDADRLIPDLLSASSANLLRQLLDIDAANIGGFSPPGRRVSVHPDTTQREGNEEGTMSVRIPYFGIVKIVNGPALQLSVERDRERVRKPSASMAELPHSAGITHSQDWASETAPGRQFDSPLSTDDHLGLTAGPEEWASQGVDLAFFENILRNVNNSSSSER